MSYFWCDFLRPETRTPLARIYADLAPEWAQEEALSVSTDAAGSSAGVALGQTKPIRDLAIQGADGSWLMLIGTPLVRLRDREEEQQFLADFIAAPDRVMRDGIEGHVAAFCHDVAAQRFIVATDFNNTIPVFFAKARQGVAFASHELALARICGSEPDPWGVMQTINLGFTWDSATRFRHVQRMTPCQMLVVDRAGEIRRSDYWTPRDENPWPPGLDEQVERWTSLLRQTVLDYFECSASEAVISDFTGGEDSRMLVAACHAAGIPFKAHVCGAEGRPDVVVAKRASEDAGFDLIHRLEGRITRDDVETHAFEIVAEDDGYRDLFSSCRRFAMEAADALDPSSPKFGGVPGGEVFRGSYYLRGKTLRPDAQTTLDHRAFLKWKYLLDHRRGLLRFDDDEFLERLHSVAGQALGQVADFPVGTQIDHMLRLFQTGGWGLRNRRPAYLPFASAGMTKSIYSLRPRWKQGGRLTRTATELLWPELAFVRTRNGVPTVRRGLTRQHLFLPEHLVTAQKIIRGLNQRVLKLSPPKKIGYAPEKNTEVLDVLLHRHPYGEWFRSADTMLTGDAYHAQSLNAMLDEARLGRSRSLPTLGRIFSHELAVRWVES